MDDLSEMLFKIEIRPELFIGSRSLSDLRHFICGYCMAKQEHDPDYGLWLFEGFTAWLAARYADQRDFDLARLIEIHEENIDPMAAFYARLHEYLAQK